MYGHPDGAWAETVAFERGFAIYSTILAGGEKSLSSIDLDADVFVVSTIARSFVN